VLFRLLRFNPPARLRLRPPLNPKVVLAVTKDWQIRISYTNISISRRGQSSTVAPSDAFPTLTRYLKHLWTETVPEPLPEVLRRKTELQPRPDGREKAGHLQSEINQAMSDFEQPWIISDGEFFKIESEFFEREIVQDTEDRLRHQGFVGALDEFREARDDLTDGSYRDTISKSANSLESTLKVVTGSNGELTKLTESFLASFPRRYSGRQAKGHRESTLPSFGSSSQRARQPRTRSEQDSS
jgi:hypothetical protein